MVSETTKFETFNTSAQAGARSRISWSAIFAGVLVAMIAQIMMTLLGLGIGMGVVNFETAGRNEAANIGIASGIWWLVSGIISLFLGGWVAGRLAGMPRSLDGALHGMLTWAFASLLSLYLMTTTVGAFLNGSTQLLTRGVEQITAASPEIGQAAETAMREAGISPTRAEAEVREAGREAAAAARSVNEGDVRQAADTAARGAGTTAFWAFGILLVGMIAAALGGRQGSPPEWETEAEQSTTEVTTTPRTGLR